MQQESGFTEGRSIIKSGKLIKVWARFQGNIIAEIKITGDFFIYPESTIEILEKKIIGKKINEIKETIQSTLQNCECIGIDSESIYRAVIEAWKKRE